MVVVQRGGGGGESEKWPELMPLRVKDGSGEG